VITGLIFGRVISYALAASTALAGGYAVVQTVRLNSLQAKAAQAELDRTEEALKVSQLRRAQEQGLQFQREQNIETIQAKLDKADVLAADLRTLGKRLRDTEADLANAHLAAPGAGAVASGEAGEAAARMLAELRGELDSSEATRYRFADRAQAKSVGCEAEYEAVRKALSAK